MLGTSEWRCLLISRQRQAPATKESLLILPLPDAQLSSSPVPHPELLACLSAASCCLPGASGVRRMCPQQQQCQPVLPGAVFHCPLLCSALKDAGTTKRQQIRKPGSGLISAISCLWELGLGPRLSPKEPWDSEAHKSLPPPSEAAWDPARSQRLPTRHGPLHTWQTKRSELRFPTPLSA